MSDQTLPAVVAATPAALPPGALPLRNARHERYARARSLLRPKAVAYREAGFESENDHAARGNASKIERRKDVLDRIAYLVRQDEEVLRAKRAHLEEFLWAIHETNYAEFWEVVDEEVLDEGGEPVLDAEGKPKTRKRQRLKFLSDLDPDQQRLVQSLKYTETGRPNLETYSKMQANIELRKLLGIGASKDDDGNELSHYSDDDLLALLSREAAALGIDVDLTVKFRGSAA